MAHFSYSQQLTFIFIVVSGFVFYYHLFKIQSSGISPEESSKILPLQNFEENFPGVDYYINYVAGLLYAVDKNSKYASLSQNPIPLHLLVGISEYQFPISAAKCLTKQQVFIAVISAPGNFENRKVIRETWFLYLSNSSYRFAFIVGLIENRTIQRKIEE